MAGEIPSRPPDNPGKGHTWVYDEQNGWREVPMEIRTPSDPPFFSKNTSPLKLPIDANPPKPQSPN
jgi:hypothetical protein